MAGAAGRGAASCAWPTRKARRRRIPFWLGEAPARSDELSRAVSDLRDEIDRRARTSPRSAASQRTASIDWLASKPATIGRAAARAGGRRTSPKAARALGVVPTQETLVLERFFDESGGMQLVLHAPFGSRINKAWGLALRKRFCRQFNFELQAAATEDALLLSLGPQHSFPLADVFRYLHPATTRDVLVQAFLDAPVFQTRWRWNTTISLAVPRNRRRTKVRAAAAADAGRRPDGRGVSRCRGLSGKHPRRSPDPGSSAGQPDDPRLPAGGDGLRRARARARRAFIAASCACVARDTPEPSPFAHEILNARPYAFLDDAPLEERRTHAVQTRRAPASRRGSDLGALDAAAIERVRDEVRPDPRDADELHDALLTVGFLTRGGKREIDDSLFPS